MFWLNITTFIEIQTIYTLQVIADKWNNHYQSSHVNGRLSIYYTYGHPGDSTFASDVIKGLSSAPKYLLPRYFYDERGSELFEKICTTNEYYLTRTETLILEKYSDEISGELKDVRSLVELGSGNSSKTRILIDSFMRKIGYLHYLPIDVSSILIDSSNKLILDVPRLKISGIISEYRKGIELVSYINSVPKLIIFLGSSIGNFDFDEAKDFLKYISSYMTEDDYLLVGFDMQKSLRILDKAYNDSAGFTALFNLNLLKRINNELGGNFDLNSFKHKAFFNKKESRIEMHLVSKKEQSIAVKSIKKVIRFQKDESIHTENSYKFTDEMVENIASHAGLTLNNSWSDERSYFSLCLFKKINPFIKYPSHT
jgi:L-histidine N-alpha-methyltransferase